MIKSLRKKIFRLLNSTLNRKGFALIRWTNEQQRVGVAELPEASKKYLVNDNPKLQSLIDSYNVLPSDITNSKVWNWSNGALDAELLHFFRGDKAYVWQLKGIDIPELRYLTTTYYQMVNDKLGLLDKFIDDPLFGNHLFQIAGRTVSREVLDSINEINFLEKHLTLSAIKGLKILDIGAGYGRLAHRVSQSFDNLEKYYCTDGVPLSAFICDYYINFRNIKNAEVVEMPQAKTKLSGQTIHLAINIHSFSECSFTAIDWWLELVSSLNIRYLMIVPNAFRDGESKLLTNRREDFSPLLLKYKYKQIVKAPKYSDTLMQKLGLYPSYYYLFERQSS